MPFITQGKTNWKFLLIVIVLAIIVGGGALWYSLKKEKPYETPKIQAKTCDEKCKSLGYTSGQCGANTSGKGACLEDEADVGVTKDCEVGETKAFIVPRTCCCGIKKITDETPNWKTYRNEEYGFEVKYPPEWKTVSEFPGRLGPGQTEFVEGINPQSFIFAPNSKDLAKDEADVIFYVAPEGYFNCSSYPNLSNNSVTEFLKQNITEDEIEFCKSNIYFRFSVTTPQKEIFDQILSTFKFIEASSSDFKVIGTDKETGWDIGRSDNYGFEIKYPSINLILIEEYIGPSVVAYLKMINESDQTEGDLFILVNSATSSDKCDGPSQIYEVEGFPVTSSALIGPVIFTRIDYYSDAIDLNRDYTTFRNGFCYNIHLVAYPYSCISSGCGDRRWSEVTFQAMLNNFDSIVNTFRFISQ